MDDELVKRPGNVPKKDVGPFEDFLGLLGVGAFPTAPGVPETGGLEPEDEEDGGWFELWLVADEELLENFPSNGIRDVEVVGNEHSR